MKIKYCRKYEKYVSQQHCEFFNEGQTCPYYTDNQWNTIRQLLEDPNRPKWEVKEIIKPFMCELLDRANLHRISRRNQDKRRSVAARL